MVFLGLFVPTEKGQLVDREHIQELEAMGTLIRKKRTELGYSQEDLAYLTGLTFATINRLESGQHDPRLTTVLKVAKVLKLKVFSRT